MQNNVITSNGVEYERWQESDNRSVYIAADHSVAKPHTLTLGRVVPTAPAASSKVRAKLSRTVDTTSPTGVVGYAPLITELNVSVPAGVVSESTLTKLRDDLVAFISGEEFKSLLVKQEI